MKIVAQSLTIWIENISKISSYRKLLSEMWTSPLFLQVIQSAKAIFLVQQQEENTGNQSIQQGFKSSSYISIQFDRDRMEKGPNIFTDAALKWKDIPSSNSYTTGPGIIIHTRSSSSPQLLKLIQLSRPKLKHCNWPPS